MKLPVVVGEGSVDISDTSAAAVGLVELLVLGVGSAAMSVWPVDKGEGFVAVVVCLTSDTTGVDSVANLNGSVAVVETVD